MILLLSCALVVLIGIGLCVESDGYGGQEFAGTMVTVFGGVALASLLFTLPINRMGVHADLAEIEAMRDVANAARDEGDGLEGATWRLRVSEANEKLANLRYWNGTVFDIWIPDAVESVEPLR